MLHGLSLIIDNHNDLEGRNAMDDSDGNARMSVNAQMNLVIGRT